MWRSIASNALTLFIVVLVAAAGLLAWGREQFSGPGPLEQAICFRVERGDSLSAVSRALEEPPSSLPPCPRRRPCCVHAFGGSVAPL